MTPLVSVLLPNLNNRPFLEERVASIRNQTMADWELIVVDNFSEDGAWELLQSLAAGEPRMKVSQAPRTGMYANWNNCVARASGKYTYIATSDDTMAPDCLELLTQALERHADCDLAHCRLRMFDAQGKAAVDWWTGNSVFAHSSGPLLDVPHVRLAPYDGLLHWAGASVYISITQLLIRTALFRRVGLFETQWGSMGDFNWNMRAALVANTVHVPETWGGWRLHANQATAANSDQSPAYWRKLDDMMADALQRSERALPPRLAPLVKGPWARMAQQGRDMDRYRGTGSWLTRKAHLMSELFSGSWAAREHIKARVNGTDFNWQKLSPGLIQNWLARAGVEKTLVPSPNVHEILHPGERAGAFYQQSV